MLGLPIGLFALHGELLDRITYRVKETKDFPNQGINFSLKNSLTLLLVLFGLSVLILGLIGLRYGLFLGLFFGVTVGLNRGGLTVIKHYALRLILWRSGYTPFKFIQFLDQCARLILLKKVGGGYIFIHRMLLEYFSDIPTQHTSAKRDSSISGTQK